MWTTLAPLKVIQQTYELIPRSPTCLMDDILNPRCHSCIVHHDDRPPLVVVNRVGLPQTNLPTFLNFPHFRAFRNGGLGMIWDSHSSNMKKPNVDEKERAMGFRINTIIVQGIFKGTFKQNLGQVMDLNCSHELLIWSWHNSYILANHTHPFCPIFHLLHLLMGQLWWCKRGGG